MATITRYVDHDSPDGGNGTTTSVAAEDANRAYHSLADWEGHEQADLTDGGGDIMVVICAGAASVDDHACTIGTWTTSATCYIDITGDHVGTLDTAKYVLHPSTGAALNIQEEFTRIHNLIIISDDNNCVSYGGAGSEHHIEKCIIQGSATAGKNGILAGTVSAASVIKIWNSIIFGMSEGTSFGIYTNDADWTGYVENCTLIANGRGIRVTTATWYVNNCGVFDSGNDNSYVGTGLVCHHCVTDSTDVTGDAGDCVQSHADFAWTNQTTNWTLTASHNHGDNSHNAISFSDDIAGNARSTWDVGANEYVAGGASVIPLVMHHYSQN